MNNVNNGCPALMSDGHFLRDWRAECYVHSLIDAQNGNENSFQSRMFFQNNALKLMAANRKNAYDIGLCHNECKFYHVDPNGHDKYWKAYKSNLERKTN